MQQNPVDSIREVIKAMDEEGAPHCAPKLHYLAHTVNAVREHCRDGSSGVPYQHVRVVAPLKYSVLAATDAAPERLDARDEYAHVVVRRETLRLLVEYVRAVDYHNGLVDDLLAIVTYRSGDKQDLLSSLERLIGIHKNEQYERYKWMSMPEGNR